MMDSVDYYDLLGCTKESTAEDIKRAYYALALKLHPDKNASEFDGIKFQRILEAWNVLRDPASREEYDAVRRQEELDAGNSLIYARVSASELEAVDDSEDTLVYRCRCGGLYLVQREYLCEKNRSIHVPCMECTFLVIVET